MNFNKLNFELCGVKPGLAKFRKCYFANLLNQIYFVGEVEGGNGLLLLNTLLSYGWSTTST